jgi:hypothetical protein
MALLLLYWGPKTRKKNTKIEIVHPKGIFVQILTKKGLNMSLVKQISPWNPSDGTFDFLWGPGTRKILEILKFDILRDKFLLKKVKTFGLAIVILEQT